MKDHVRKDPHPSVEIREIISNDATEACIKCDVYFDPLWVWEIKAADLSLSPMHTAGIGRVDLGNPDRGVALRFNRYMRDRLDKRP
jgi:DNA ligase 1